MSSQSHDRLFHAADSTLGLLLFFTAKLAYLRGTWDLWGWYVYSGYNPKAEWVMVAIGGLGTLVFGYLVCPHIDRWLMALKERKRNVRCAVFLCFTVKRICFYVQAAINIAFMRGVWDLSEYYVGERYGWPGRLGLFFCSYAALVLLKASRTCLTVPFVALLDTRKSILVPATRFRVKVQWDSALSLSKYAVDAIVTQFAIGTLVSIIWSSYLMFLVSVVVISGDAALSAGCCFVVGASACIVISFCLERPLALLGTKIESRGGGGGGMKWPTLLYHDCVFLCVFLCQGMLWGGAWRLDKAYILPHPMIGGWIHHGVGTVLLAGLQIFSSSIAGVGCAVDGSDASVVVIFPRKYLSSIKSRIDETRNKEKKNDKNTKEVPFHITTSVYAETVATEFDYNATTSANPVLSTSL